VRGHLGLAPTDSELQPQGFYVTRVVKASNAADAGSRAIRVVQAESKFQKLVHTYNGVAPDLQIEKVTKTISSTEDGVNRSGYVFYESEE
jgi:hypothetical protein